MEAMVGIADDETHSAKSGYRFASVFFANRRREVRQCRVPALFEEKERLQAGTGPRGVKV